MERTIRRENGEIIIHNDIFKLKKGFQRDPSKLGLKAFARQVQYSQEAGVSHIETNAFRWKADIDPDTGKEKWSGYYVWPRFGYDGPIPQRLLDSPIWETLPAPLRGVRFVRKLIADPVGREWWKANGVAIDVKFDLTPGKYSMETLNTYLKETIPVVK